MDNNDLLRRLRYALSLDDAEAARLVRLGGGSGDAQTMARHRQRTDGEAEVEPCPDATVAALLAGLILERRGPPPDGRTAAPSIDNNGVLKALRTALALRSDAIGDCMRAGGADIADGAVGAFLRRPDARNFRGLGDQLLRRFLRGLALRERAPEGGPRTTDQATP